MGWYDGKYTLQTNILLVNNYLFFIVSYNKEDPQILTNFLPIQQISHQTYSLG
jgi:hypothetical protein